MMMQIAIGLLLVAASFFVALREILLRPSSLHYPKAPFWLRLCLFGWVVALFFVGSAVAFAGFNGQPTDWPPLVLVIATSTAAQTAAMTVNLLNQRYHPRFWSRIHRLFALAQCRPRGKLAMLEMAGFHVSAPGDRLPDFVSGEGMR